MTNLIERLKQLEAAATPGAWEHIHITAGEEILRMGEQVSFEDVERPGGWVESEADAQLIAEMRNALPQLLDRLEKLEAVVVAASGIHESLRSPALDRALAALETDK